MLAKIVILSLKIVILADKLTFKMRLCDPAGRDCRSIIPQALLPDRLVRECVSKATTLWTQSWQVLHQTGSELIR